MVRLALLAFVAPLLASIASAAPIPVPDIVSLARRDFVLQDYQDFQISDGTTGNAQEEAAAIFLTPFENVDLSSVSDETQDDVETMRQAAESAETEQFNPAIKAATDDATKTALQNGKIKNKVLKLTAEVQVLNIKLAKAKAAGQSTSSIEDKLAEEQTKLTKNIATDQKNAGQASKGVA